MRLALLPAVLPAAALALLIQAPLAAPLLANTETARTEPTGHARVVITITDLRNDKGVVRACMTPNVSRFPRCQGDANSFRVVVPAGEAGRIDFGPVPPGTYAIALLHDENNNGKADRALGMMPREGFGFSRDARVVMAPPKFADAAFEVGTAPINQRIKMRYML